jgi:hypothetical protein
MTDSAQPVIRRATSTSFERAGQRRAARDDLPAQPRWQSQGLSRRGPVRMYDVPAIAGSPVYFRGVEGSASVVSQKYRD